MDIENLNKNQLILLALLVSFVTSIATGIVTVTLMDQAPPGVTQTINRIVERTERVIVPQKTEQPAQVNNIVIKEEDFIVKAAEKNSANIVVIGYPKKKTSLLQGLVSDQQKTEIENVGTGFVIKEKNVVLGDRAQMPEGQDEFVITTLGGEAFAARRATTTGESSPIILLELISPSSQEGKDEAAASSQTKEETFNAVTFADTALTRIGQTAIALGADRDLQLLLGVVSRLERVAATEDKGGSRIAKIYTTVEMDSRYSGGPVVNTDGAVMGIAIVADGSHYVVPALYIEELLAGNGKTKEGEEPLANKGEKTLDTP
ncbi:MAG: trypsin-like peptidase domain-containing protein [Parcubacteria group bacterium]|nr:trypsin-like peptidase domain-containing protein [Parcubacteria group bacterium]